MTPIQRKRSGCWHSGRRRTNHYCCNTIMRTKKQMVPSRSSSSSLLTSSSMPLLLVRLLVLVVITLMQCLSKTVVSSFVTVEQPRVSPWQQQQHLEQSWSIRSSRSRTLLRGNSIQSSGVDGIYQTKDDKERKQQPSPRKQQTPQKKTSGFAHTMAILTFPKTAMDRIANECILERAIASVDSLVPSADGSGKMVAGKLSVVLKCQDDQPHRTPLWELCSFINDLYSHSWDVALEKMELDLQHLHNLKARGELSEDIKTLPLLDICIYPQSLPNAAPEQWIYKTSDDLDCICSSNSFMGWHSSTSDSSNVYTTKEGAGLGGLQSHVDAVNIDRTLRNLSKVQALEVELPDGGTKHPDVLFLEDERQLTRSNDDSSTSKRLTKTNGNGYDSENPSLGLLGGVRLEDNTLFTNVCVGGTFDGMHYGHRKLLTLAVASVDPNIGKLSVGVTSDSMLKHKQFSNLIPPLSARVLGVKNFLDRLAPGLKNRRKIIAINDEMGPTATDPTLDALVLSHETLRNGHLLNEYRSKTKGWNKLKLLCTRRTEQHSMSSTALRRRLKDYMKQQAQQD